jgi:hypothetical protein
MVHRQFAMTSMPLLMGGTVGLSCTVSVGLRSVLATLDVATDC